ncbi:7182_t:CDS:2 [Dentiscutata erythropus]|uniref:7182_t:CDS:1 n=1 Tax=Dentiscutata erythropus TaxID=1348616 RepID=A0A9N8VCZ8_9GLOM|nr:7182_t:CDS:2 [Dentiscutata erythropus]
MIKTKKPLSMQPTTTRPAVSTSRSTTSTIIKSTVSTTQSNNTRSVTSTSQSATQPATSTAQLRCKSIIKPNSPIQLWKEIDELRNITRQQERTMMNMMDQINYLTSTAGTLVCEVNKLRVLCQPEDQGSLDLVMAESSNNTLQRSVSSEVTTGSNSVFEDDKERKKELRKEIFFLLKEKGVRYDLDYDLTWSEQKDRLAKNTIPVLINVLGDRYNTNRNELADILKQRHKSSRNTLSVRRDPSRSARFDERVHKNTRRAEKRSRRTAAFKYLTTKNDKHIKKYNSNEIKKLLSNSDIHSPEISDSAEEKDEKGNVYVNVYDLSWRSDELRNFVHDVLDATMPPNYVRPRRKTFVLNLSAPEGLPDWAVAEDDDESEYDSYSSDNEENDIKSKGKSSSVPLRHKRRRR